MNATTKPSIDLNADLGEGYPYDELILDCVSSASIACGGHAGNAASIRQTLLAAKKRGVNIGAHPSYPDTENFGRKTMLISPDDLHASLTTQLENIQSIALELNIKLKHVKPHGALYNDAAKDPVLAQQITKTCLSFDQNLCIIGLAGSELIAQAKAAGLATLEEAFVDRRYCDDGSLLSRKNDNAVFTSPAECLQQAKQIVIDKKVTSATGKTVSIHADTLCLHGDNKKAVAIAQLISTAFNTKKTRC